LKRCLIGSSEDWNTRFSFYTKTINPRTNQETKEWIIMDNENEEIKVTDERADDRIAVHIREQSINFNSPSCCAAELWCGLNGHDVVVCA